MTSSAGASVMPDFAMQQLLKQMGQEQKVLPILELNPKHEVFAKLKSNETFTPDIAQIVLGMAKLSEGIGIDEPSAFNKALNKIIIKALG